MQITPITPEAAQDYFTERAESALDRLIKVINEKYLLKGKRRICQGEAWIEWKDIIQNVSINKSELLEIAADVYRSVGWHVEYPWKESPRSSSKWMIFKPDAKLPTVPKNAVPVKPPGFPIVP